jgi:mRNA interferase MazF
MAVKRGDIYVADLPIDVEGGSEQQGTRPVLVIQNNLGNLHSPTVIIAPISSRMHKARRLPTHVILECRSRLCFVELEQIRTIDKRRLRTHIGQIDEETQSRVNQAIKVSLAI